MGLERTFLLPGVRFSDVCVDACTLFSLAYYGHLLEECTNRLPGAHFTELVSVGAKNRILNYERCLKNGKLITNVKKTD